MYMRKAIWADRVKCEAHVCCTFGVGEEMGFISNTSKWAQILNDVDDGARMWRQQMGRLGCRAQARR